MILDVHVRISSAWSLTIVIEFMCPYTYSLSLLPQQIGFLLQAAQDGGVDSHHQPPGQSPHWTQVSHLVLDVDIF